MSEIKRTVTVFNQNTQETKVVENVVAETFGDLKKVLSNEGVNFNGMDVREGISKVDLKVDSAILPHDMPYRGGKTNDLMILLTKSNKQISSGSGRTEAVAYIKANNLQDEVKNTYHKNWTNVSTDDLVKFVEKHQSKAPAAAPKAEKAEKPAAKNGAENCPQAATSGVVEAVKTLVEALFEDEVIDEDVRMKVLAYLNGNAGKEEAPKQKGFSQSEIYEALAAK